MAGGPGVDGASGWGLEGNLRQWAITAGISILGLILLAFCVGLPGDEDSVPADGNATLTPTPTAGSSASVTPTAAPPASEGGQSSATATPAETARSTRVGNIELELIEIVHPYDATQHAGLNAANVRLDLRATGVGEGGGYFTAFELTLMDDEGDEHGLSSCLDCPGNLDSLELAEGDSGDGSAYLELPEGREPHELIYRGSASGDEGRIPLR